jgi:hypothetical protein
LISERLVCILTIRFGQILLSKEKPVNAQRAISFSTSSDAASDEVRLRALLRLYERRETVNELISVLEKYEQERMPRRAPCIDISAARKCLSGSAQ